LLYLPSSSGIIPSTTSVRASQLPSPVLPPRPDRPSGPDESTRSGFSPPEPTAHTTRMRTRSLAALEAVDVDGSPLKRLRSGCRDTFSPPSPLSSLPSTPLPEFYQLCSRSHTSSSSSRPLSIRGADMTGGRGRSSSSSSSSPSIASQRLSSVLSSSGPHPRLLYDVSSSGSNDRNRGPQRYYFKVDRCSCNYLFGSGDFMDDVMHRGVGYMNAAVPTRPCYYAAHPNDGTW
jgi:hypothetical protein